VAAIGDRLAVGGNEKPSLRLGPSMALGSDEHVGESGEGGDGSCAAKLLANWMAMGKISSSLQSLAKAPLCIFY